MSCISNWPSFPVQFKLTIEYDGTQYNGWQLQQNAPTVQGAVEAALARLFSTPVRVRVAGRTDTGVHASGQVVTFTPVKSLEPQRLQHSLNAILPTDIAVKQVEEVPDAFNPRRDARSRQYRYRIWNAPWRSPLWARYSWHLPYPLQVEEMNRAAALLIGDHDFSSFKGSDSVERRPQRTMLSSRVQHEEEFVLYDVEARSFLRHMVRNIVGTLVDVGRGALSVEEFARIFAARDRRQAGLNAPPQGLCLVEVKY
ncbi:MAG: tRNA pseudouridine(38-40) synthase TruA [Deltaproteobacteria bacterium]|nr:tRNA pseudouridine(38-40) synthase TruA [Deltaproteobacteria bacterium]